MRAHYKRWTEEYSPEETETLIIANSHGRFLKDYLGSRYTVAFKPGGMKQDIDHILGFLPSLPINPTRVRLLISINNIVDRSGKYTFDGYANVTLFLDLVNWAKDTIKKQYPRAEFVIGSPIPRDVEQLQGLEVAQEVFSGIRYITRQLKERFTVFDVNIKNDFLKHSQSKKRKNVLNIHYYLDDKIHFNSAGKLLLFHHLKATFG